MNGKINNWNYRQTRHCERKGLIINCDSECTNITCIGYLWPCTVQNNFGSFSALAIFRKNDTLFYSYDSFSRKLFIGIIYSL